MAVSHLAPDRQEGSFQNPFWHGNVLEKRHWLWAIAILQRKKEMKSEGDECQPPRNHRDGLAWAVQPAGPLMRKIKSCTHWWVSHDWLNEQALDSGPDFHSPGLSSM